MIISKFCTSALEIVQFVGWILTIFKIAIPLVIIAYGTFDLAKAVVASKDDEIKTQTKRLLYRALAGVLIFFLPTLTMWLFGAISDLDHSSFKRCEKCFLTPWNQSCESPDSNDPADEAMINLCTSKQSEEECLKQSECVWEEIVWQPGNFSCAYSK